MRENRHKKIFSNTGMKRCSSKLRKDREADEAISWLTGYTLEQIDASLASEIAYGAFLSGSPADNPRAGLITGKMCGQNEKSSRPPAVNR